MAQRSGDEEAVQGLESVDPVSLLSGFVSVALRAFLIIIASEYCLPLQLTCMVLSVHGLWDPYNACICYLW